MAVFVDPPLDWPITPTWPYGSVSHMYSDTPEELHALAERIGLKRRWCSDVTQPHSLLLHYDLNENKRRQAIRMGATPVGYQHKRGYYRKAPERARPERWV